MILLPECREWHVNDHCLCLGVKVADSINVYSEQICTVDTLSVDNFTNIVKVSDEICKCGDNNQICICFAFYRDAIPRDFAKPVIQLGFGVALRNYCFSMAMDFTSFG